MKFLEVTVGVPSKIKDISLLSEGNGSKLPQYIAAMSASFAAFSTGNVIAWTSQISPQLLDGQYGFPINQDQLGWIGSLTSLGAAFLSLIIGSICDSIGRKLTKLLMVVPLISGWALIAWAENVEMLYVGRFFTGMMGGAYLVTGPLYCNEISEVGVRGSLGSFTQLMISFGLLFDVLLGKFVSIKAYTLCCFAVPFFFAAFFVFMPETPVYYLKKNKEEAARKALRWLRGRNYDVEGEIAEIKARLEKESRGNQLKVAKEAFKRRATKIAFAVTVGLMFFRFLCGMDAVTAYTSYIFKNASESFDPGLGPIILVGLQVIFGIIQAAVVDKIGRRILLLTSQLAIAACLILVGICFLLKSHDLIGEDAVEVVNFIPLVALAIYYIGFAVGLAPIALMMNAELNPQETKSLVSSFNNFFGWLLAFGVTKTFLLIDEGVGAEGNFFIYGGISLVGVFFIWFVVPETKGKSPEEIQALLEKL